MTGLKKPLETFRKSAKRLTKGIRSGEPEAMTRAARVFRDFSATEFGLMQAQHVVAAEHGYRSWSELTEAPAHELYAAVTKLRKKRRFDGPTQERVRQILRENGVGIPEDVLGKPLHVLSIFPLTGGASATLAVAQEVARENARRRPWAVDLGHYQTGLSEVQAAYSAHRDHSFRVIVIGLGAKRRLDFPGWWFSL